MQNATLRSRFARLRDLGQRHPVAVRETQHHVTIARAGAVGGAEVLRQTGIPAMLSKKH
jgi:hypothetical protein